MLNSICKYKCSQTQTGVCRLTAAAPLRDEYNLGLLFTQAPTDTSEPLLMLYTMDTMRFWLVL